jgi:hypothetical protein
MEQGAHVTIKFEDGSTENYFINLVNADVDVLDLSTEDLVELVKIHRDSAGKNEVPFTIIATERDA